MNGTVYYKKKRKRFSYFDVLKDIFPCRGDGIKDVFRKLAFLSTIIVLGVCSFLFMITFGRVIKLISFMTMPKICITA